MTLQELTPEMFGTYESGGICGGIKHEIRTNLGLETHECYQYNSVDELREGAEAIQVMKGISRIRIVTHKPGYRNMRTLWEWRAEDNAREELREIINTWSLKQKIDQAHVIAFRRSLFQRWVEGDHFIVGDHRMYHDGYGISERKVKPADYQAVREALCETARRSTFCAHCQMNAARLENSMLARAGRDGNPVICCEISTIPTALCQHKNTKTNTAGSPVCQECGQSW